MIYGSVYIGPIVKIRKTIFTSWIKTYRCSENRHECSSWAKFCPECGSSVTDILQDLEEKLDDFDIEKVAPNLQYSCPFDIKEFNGFLVWTPHRGDKQWSMSLKFEDLDPIREIEEFKRDFKSDLNAIVELVGEENVEVLWRIVSCS